MTLTFFDRQDDSNPLDGRAIEHESELLALLDTLRRSSYHQVSSNHVQAYRDELSGGTMAAGLPYLFRYSIWKLVCRVEKEYKELIEKTA